MGCGTYLPPSVAREYHNFCAINMKNLMYNGENAREEYPAEC